MAIDRMDRPTDTLRAEVTEMLAAQAGDYDADAIIEALRGLGAASIEDVDEATMWRTILEHEATPVDEAAQMRAELSERIATRPRLDRPALWTSGPVTVALRGMSRVNHELPQPLASAVVSSALDKVTLSDDALTWESLWSAVETLRGGTLEAQEAAIREARTAQTALAALEQRAQGQRAHRDEAICRALEAGMTYAAVADRLGLSGAAIQKIAR